MSKENTAFYLFCALTFAALCPDARADAMQSSNSQVSTLESRSGGSATTREIKIEKSNDASASTASSAKASLKAEKLESGNDKTKRPVRRIPASRSGGSQSSNWISFGEGRTQ